MTTLTTQSQRTSDPPELPADVQVKLRRLANRLRRLAVLRGIGLSLAAFGGTLAIGLLADSLWELPQALRIGWLVFSIALTAACLVWYIARPLLRRYRGIDLAAVVEVAHLELGERLSSLIELSDPDLPAIWRGSALMLRGLSQETVAAVQNVDFDSSISEKPYWRSLCVGVGVLLIAGLPGVASPQSYALALARFFAPWGNYDRAGDLYFEIEGGDRVAPRGGSLTLRAELRSRSDAHNLPREAQLQLRYGADTHEMRDVRFDSRTDSFAVTLPNLQAGFSYCFVSGSARSKFYQVQVVDPPKIESCQLQAVPPAYTKMKPQTFDGAVGEMLVFEHSDLTIAMQFQQSVVEAELLFGSPGLTIAAEPGRSDDRDELPKLPIPISDDGQTATVNFAAERSNDFTILLTDRHGFHNRENATRSLRILRDRPPEFVEARDQEPLVMRPDGPLVVTVTARDDFGVGRLQLHCELPGGEQKVVDAPAKLLPTPAVKHTFEVDLSSAALQDGMSFTLYFRAADQRPVPGPQWTTSATRTVNVEEHAASFEEQSLVREQDRLLQELTAIQNEVRRRRQVVRHLADRPLTSELTEEDEFRVAETRTKLEDLSQRLHRLDGSFSERPLLASLSPETRNVADESLRSSQEEIAEAAGKDGKQRQSSFSAAERALGEADDRLTELKRRFEKLAKLERDLLDLQQLAAEAEALSRQLAALQRRQAELDAQPDSAEKRAQLGQLAEQKRQAEEAAAKLAEQLKELVEQHPEILAAARQAAMRRFGRLGLAARGIADGQRDLVNEIEQEVAQPQVAARDDRTKSLIDLIQAQRAVAERAVDLARNVARAFGPASEEARRGLSFAGQAHAVVRAAMRGQIRAAAKSARQAAESAEHLSGQSAEQRRAAEELLSRQQELSRLFAEMLSDPSQRQAAQRFGQHNLASQTEELQRQLEEITRSLESKPLDLQPQGEQARQAGQRAVQAQQRMQQTTESLDQSDPQRAALQGEQATQILDEIADAIRQAAGNQQEQTGEMPGDAANDIAQAMQQLQQAREQLQQQQSQSSPNNQQNGGEQQAGQQGADAKVKQAADSLSQAHERLQLGQGKQRARRGTGRRSQQSGQAGSPGNAAGGSGSNSADAEMQALREEFERLSGRRWGELPGSLRTEILKSASRRSGGDYEQIIRRYFKELARTKPSE